MTRAIRTLHINRRN